jgi:tetratricopeptide (TPR) repeat protein
VQGRQGLETVLRGLSAAGDIVQVSNLYLRHKTLLTTPKVNGPTGLLIAGALTRLGLIDSSIALTLAALSAGVPVEQREYGMVALAEAYHRKGDVLRQEQSWKAYLRQYPQGSWAEEAREGVVMALGRGGKQKEAQTVCETYLGSNDKSAQDAKGPRSQTMILLCADRFTQAGNLQSAERLYKEILKNEPAPEEALWANYQIARASKALNHSDEARGLFEEVSKTDKDAILAQAASAQLAQLTASEKR